MVSFQLSSRSRTALLLFALVALIGPNGMFLYNYFAEPDLLRQTNDNPVALAFMIEAMMMMGLFLVYIWFKTRSAMQVVLYLALTFAGSLAFSFAVFVYINSKIVREKPV